MKREKTKKLDHCSTITLIVQIRVSSTSNVCYMERRYRRATQKEFHSALCKEQTIFFDESVA